MSELGRYLVIVDGVVKNIIVGTAPVGDCVEQTEDLMHVGIGWTLVDGEWVAPEGW